jgi:hypothetical protein
MKSEWISVKDSLPKEGVFVLVFNKDADIFMAKMLRFYPRGIPEVNWFFVPDNCGCIDIFDTSTVTHWMPLPEKPE